MYKDEDVHLSVGSCPLFCATLKYHKGLRNHLRCNITLEYYVGVNMK